MKLSRFFYSDFRLSLNIFQTLKIIMNPIPCNFSWKEIKKSGFQKLEVLDMSTALLDIAASAKLF